MRVVVSSTESLSLSCANCWRNWKLFGYTESYAWVLNAPQAYRQPRMSEWRRDSVVPFGEEDR